MSNQVSNTAPAPLLHIIWDWNGTLLDDSEYCREVMNAMLTRRNMPLLTAERYQEIFDFPVQRYYERIGFDFALEPFETLGTEFINAYNAGRHACALQPGARDMLAWLSDQGIPMSVLSAYRHHTLETILHHHDVARYLTHILGVSDDYATGKVEQGRNLMTRLGLPPASVLMIGDTLHDADVAHALGVTCWLVLSGSQNRDRLIQRGCPVFDNLVHVFDHLRQELQPCADA